MRLPVLLGFIATTACDLPLSTNDKQFTGHITFSSATFQTSPSVQPPFLSVVDSVALVITPPDGPPIVRGQGLTGRDTIASFPVDLREGPVRVHASVLSLNGTVLFEGETSANVDRDGFHISVPLTAQGPVLVITPDSAPGLIPRLGRTSVRVHNRGIGNLDFAIVDTSSASRTQCRPLRCFVISAPNDVVVGQSSLLIDIDSIRPVALPIGITVSSDAGDVVFVLRTQPKSGLTPARVDPGNFRDRVGVIGRAETLVADVRDANGAPVPDVVVEWRLTTGTGELGAAASFTDASGIASMTFTPGTVAGSNVVEATVPGASTGRYLIWTPSLPAARVVATTGNNQTGVVGRPMPTEIRARVEDQYGNGVYGDTVHFAITAGRGYVERTFLVTDSSGYTEGNRWITALPGAAQVTARASAGTTTFDATAVASTTPSLFIETQPIVTAPPLTGTGADVPVTVRVVNAAGAPLVREPVTWESAGRITTTATDANGRSTNRVWYDDSSPGVRTATIRSAGATATLYIVVLPSGAGVTGFATPPPGNLSARVGTRVESVVIAHCFDRQGGPASSCSVMTQGPPPNFGSGGTIFPAPGYRPPGQRAFYWILPSTPGTYQFCVQLNCTDARAIP